MRKSKTIITVAAFLGLVVFSIGAKLHANENIDETTQEISTDQDVVSKKPIAGTVTVSVEPFWLLVSGIGGKVDYAVNDLTSVGFSGVVIPKHNNESTSDKNGNNVETVNYKWSYTEFNLGANYMLSGDLRSNGAYISPAVGYSRSEISNYSDLNLSGELSAPHARLTAGYQWINGDFKLSAGAGLKLAKSEDIVIRDSNGAELLRQRSSSLGGLALDFQFGYMF